MERMFKIFNNQLVEAPVGRTETNTTAGDFVVVSIFQVSAQVVDVLDFPIQTGRKYIYFCPYMQPDYFRKNIDIIRWKALACMNIGQESCVVNLFICRDKSLPIKCTMLLTCCHALSQLPRGRFHILRPRFSCEVASVS